MSANPGRRAASTSAKAAPASGRPGLETRLCAQRLLGAVIETATSLDGLTDDSHGHPSYLALEGRDRSLARAILSSALRHRRTITGFLDRLIDKPLPANARSLIHLLHVGAAQILFLDIPDHSAVDLAVEAARADPRNARFASLVNAVLRRMTREKDGLLPVLAAGMAEAPDWLLAALEAQYGRERARAIVAMHGHEAPVDFTVRSDPQDWARRLGGFVLPNGSVRVARLACAVPDLDGFAEGQWWVQDVAASLPARLLGDVRGKQVLDLCAAPGGKTAQLAAAGALVTAVDLSASRLRRLSANMARLALKVETWQGSALAFDPPQRFDSVLLDAPCSSTGTIRRHPDVAWTKSAQDVSKLARLQQQLLAKAANLLKPGGVLVFSNCSLLAEEGEQTAAFAAANLPALEVLPVTTDELPGMVTLVTPDGWLRSTPADLPLGEPEISGMDGFFAARFSRK